MDWTYVLWKVALTPLCFLYDQVLLTNMESWLIKLLSLCGHARNLRKVLHTETYVWFTKHSSLLNKTKRCADDIWLRLPIYNILTFHKSFELSKNDFKTKLIWIIIYTLYSFCLSFYFLTVWCISCHQDKYC